MTTDREALADQIEQSDGLVLMLYGGGTTSQLGIKKTALIVAALRADLSTLSGEVVAWAVSRWNAEVKNRPLQNIHRRSIDTTWRQMIRHFGGDDVALVGPTHDDLLAALNPATPAVEGK